MFILIIFDFLYSKIKILINFYMKMKNLKTRVMINFIQDLDIKIKIKIKSSNLIKTMNKYTHMKLKKNQIKDPRDYKN